jgi:hypothetical protein
MFIVCCDMFRSDVQEVRRCYEILAMKLEDLRTPAARGGNCGGAYRACATTML